jgi:hypothetical protein
MPSKTLKWEILKALNDAPKGLNVLQVRDFIDYDCRATIGVYLCNYEREGLVYRDGRAECPHCLATKVCYRITEQGRIYVAEKKETI